MGAFRRLEWILMIAEAKQSSEGGTLEEHGQATVEGLFNFDNFPIIDLNNDWNFQSFNYSIG